MLSVVFVILLSGMAVPIVLVLAAVALYPIVLLVLLYMEWHDRWAPALGRFSVGHIPSALMHWGRRTHRAWRADRT